MRPLLLLFVVCFVLPAKAQIRLTKVDPVSREISIRNFGATEVDITDYRLCSSLVYTGNLTTNVTIISGDLVLSAEEEVTISWDPANAFDVEGRDMGLYLPGAGGFGSAANMVDYMQYLGSFAAPEGRENVANTAGIWTPGTFVSGEAPYTYTGNGTDVGADFWTGVAPACAITALSTGSQSACAPASNTYTQDVVVTFENAPGTGSLDVNGQTFAIGTSPQTVTLTGLTADGNSVDVTASFTADGACTLTRNDLFTAPADCTPQPCAITALSAGTQTSCVPASNTYTQEVVVTYENAPATGSLEVNGQTFAIGASPQTVTLTGLTADGNSVNVTASFTADGSCTLSSNGLFTAPDDCTPPSNEDPVAQDDQANTLQNQAVSIEILANDSDADGSLDLTSVVITQATVNGQTSIDGNGVVEYTPDTDFIGTDSFSYTVNDDEGATSNVAMVNITIDAVTSVSCAFPKNLKVRSLQTNSVGLTWNHIPEAQYFLIELNGSSETKTLETKHNNIDIKGLNSGINYTWKVYSICEDGQVSEAGIGDPFLTLSQGAGIDLNLSNGELLLEVDRSQVRKLKMILFNGRGQVLKRLEASKSLESQYKFKIPRQLKGQVLVIRVKTNLGRVQKKMLFSP